MSTPQEVRFGRMPKPACGDARAPRSARRLVLPPRTAAECRPYRGCAAAGGICRGSCQLPRFWAKDHAADTEKYNPLCRKAGWLFSCAGWLLEKASLVFGKAGSPDLHRVCFCKKRVRIFGKRVCFFPVQVCLWEKRVCFSAKRVVSVSKQVCFFPLRVCFETKRVCFFPLRVCFEIKRVVFFEKQTRMAPLPEVPRPG